MNPISEHPLYYYVSTQAACDPVKTIYLCVPDGVSGTVEAAEAFARKAGWVEIAEREAAILVVPAAPNGWENQDPGFLKSLYLETRNRFTTHSGQAIWGRRDSLWCWETILYAVGYGEGAAFVGRTLVAHPNLLACGVMVGDVPTDFSAGENASDHWLVPKVCEGYSMKNGDIPVQAWFYLQDTRAADPAKAYFEKAYSGENPAEKTVVRFWDGNITPALSREIMADCLNHVIRWKDGPEGALAPLQSRSEFYNNAEFTLRWVKTMGAHYSYFVHIPEGMTKEKAVGLPLVFTIHGRGEPAWMFMEKNGWVQLCDRTQEFVLVAPDSPGNIWFLDRDRSVFPAIVQDMAEAYKIDTCRVYLTGFSNGGTTTREVGIAHPELFAGVSPWNGPYVATEDMRKDEGAPLNSGEQNAFAPTLRKFLEEGYELPCAVFCGDRDGIALLKDNRDIQTFAPGCETKTDTQEIRNGDNYYTPERGFAQGHRFSTSVYRNQDGEIRLLATEMKNMPHGAIQEESLAAWEFLRCFRREPGSKTVIKFQ